MSKHAPRSSGRNLHTISRSRLGILFMYEAPTIFWALWTAVKPFIDPETKRKVRFVGVKDLAKEGILELMGEVRHDVLLY